jgi:hypothetical protein
MDGPSQAESPLHRSRPACGQSKDVTSQFSQGRLWIKIRPIATAFQPRKDKAVRFELMIELTLSYNNMDI